MSLKYCFYFLLWISRYKAPILLKAKINAEKDSLLFISKQVQTTSRGITDRCTQGKISLKIQDHIALKEELGTLKVEVFYICSFEKRSLSSLIQQICNVSDNRKVFCVDKALLQK